MQDIVTKRFISCHDYLVNNNFVRSSRQFALSLEYLPQSLSEILKGRRNVTIELLRKAIEKYKLSPSYVFKGEGSLLESTNSKTNDVLVVVADENQQERIIHVPFPAQAGYGGQLHDPQYMKNLPSYTLPDPYFRTGTFRSFDITGDSMEPILFEGDRVVCSYVDRNYWKHDLRDNYVYVIITHSDVVVKRIQNNISLDGTITLISDNDYFQDRIIPIDDVIEMWLVKMKISSFVASPKNMKNAFYKDLDSMRETIKVQNSNIMELNTTISKLLKQIRERK